MESRPCVSCLSLEVVGEEFLLYFLMIRLLELIGSTHAAGVPPPRGLVAVVGGGCIPAPHVRGLSGLIDGASPLGSTFLVVARCFRMKVIRKPIKGARKGRTNGLLCQFETERDMDVP